jgi:predicted DCC family thiol-disulfide oxidoreductase YuxK
VERAEAGGRLMASPTDRVRTPVRGLAVLYDAQCRLCSFVAAWLRRQRQLVPLALVPVGSDQARAWFPALDHDGATRREVTVVGDGGQVYIGDSAWVVCLWALKDHRAFSHTLTTPRGRRLARAAVLTAAKWRDAQTRRSGGSGGSGGSEWAQWQQPDTAAGRRRHPVAPHAAGASRAPARGAPLAGRPADRRGTAPVWVYQGSGGWTQQLPEPATATEAASGPGAEGAPGPGPAGAAPPPADGPCTGGCAPPR